MDEYLQNVNERGSYQHPVDEIEPEPEDEMVVLFDHLGRLISFLAASGKPTVIGHRVLVVSYLMRPDMFPGVRSLADLGKRCDLTRQAVDKISSEFRDAFGIRTTQMRDETTREKCRKAQLKRTQK